MAKVIDIGIGAAAGSLGLAKSFNMPASKNEAETNRQISAVLAQTSAVVSDLSDKLVNGWRVGFEPVNIWDTFFVHSNDMSEIAENRVLINDNKFFIDGIDEELRRRGERNAKMPIEIDDATAARFQKISAAFNLSSDIETARLVTKFYSQVKEMQESGGKVFLIKDYERTALTF